MEKMDKVVGFYKEARPATRLDYAKANGGNKAYNGQLNPTALKRVQKLAERDGLLCHLCQQPVDLTIYAGPWRPTADHVIPSSHGGSDGLSNRKLAHAICDGKRGNKPLDSDG